MKLLILTAIVAGTQAFLFGGGGGCGCQPACPPPQPCGGGGGGYVQAPPIPPVQSYAAPPQSFAPPQQIVYQQPIAPAPSGGYVSPRVKRDNEQEFDPKCNSDVLKQIILKNIHESTAVAKRQIQKAAADEIGGRIDVICSSGTFSYIVNTELYCETEKNGTTCFAFRQSS